MSERYGERGFGRYGGPEEDRTDDYRGSFTGCAERRKRLVYDGRDG